MIHHSQSTHIEVTSDEYLPKRTPFSPEASAACFNLLVNTRIDLDGKIASAKSDEPHPQSLRGLVARQDARKQQQIDRLERLRAAQRR
jgi:hypothetical protein